jgi:hypothetical protein
LTIAAGDFKRSELKVVASLNSLEGEQLLVLQGYCILKFGTRLMIEELYERVLPNATVPPPTENGGQIGNPNPGQPQFDPAVLLHHLQSYNNLVDDLFVLGTLLNAKIAVHDLIVDERESLEQQAESATPEEALQIQALLQQNATFMAANLREIRLAAVQYSIKWEEARGHWEILKAAGEDIGPMPPHISTFRMPGAATRPGPNEA